MTSLTRFVASCFALALATASQMHGQSPAWWTAPGTSIIQSGATPNNSAVLNIGQLKNVASQAKKSLAPAIPTTPKASSSYVASNAKFELDYVDSNFDVSGGNYALANLGQLKATAKSFYDVLVSLGYDTKANLIAHGYPSSYTSNYPWTQTSTPANFAPVNIGQTKLTFSFDTALDSDSDGLPDLWEKYYFGNLGQTGSGHGDGDGISNAQEYLDDTNPADAASKRQIIYISWGGAGLKNGSSWANAADGSGNLFNDLLRSKSEAGIKSLTFRLAANPANTAYISKSGARDYYHNWADPVARPGFNLLTGWRIEGAGIDQTIIKLDYVGQGWPDPVPSSDPNSPDNPQSAKYDPNIYRNAHFGGTVLATAQYEERNIQISNLTLDCNSTKWSTITTADVTQPANAWDSSTNAWKTDPNSWNQGKNAYNIDPNAGGTVTIPVQNASVFSSYLNKKVFIQNDSYANPSSPKNIIAYGTYALTNVDTTNNTLTVRSLDQFYHHDTEITNRTYFKAPGTTIPAGSRIFLALQIGAINIGNTNCKITSVRVKNGGCNEYEGNAGIFIVSLSSSPSQGDQGTGNLISGCKIDTTWGLWGSALGLSSCNWVPDVSYQNPGVKLSGVVENNELTGNGLTAQAMGCNGLDYSVFRNNVVRNFYMGFFIDLGNVHYLTVKNNTFEDTTFGIKIGGGTVVTWDNALIANNTVRASSYGIFFGGSVHNSRILNNVVDTPAPGITLLVLGAGYIPGDNSSGNWESGNVTPLGAPIPASQKLMDLSAMLPGYTP